MQREFERRQKLLITEERDELFHEADTDGSGSITLEELEIPYETHAVDLSAGDQKQEDIVSCRNEPTIFMHRAETEF